jgi:hypothetical protein
MGKKRYIKEVEEESLDDKLKNLDVKILSLTNKSKELSNQIVNSKSQANAASAQASRAVGVSPEAESQDKKMKTAMAAKSRADLKYYQDELTKIKDEINIPSAIAMMTKLTTDNGTMIEQLTKTQALAEENNKMGLANFLQDRIDAHEKNGWMLRSIIKA